MLKVRFNQIKALILIPLFSFLALFHKKRVWVISERGVDARDNGYYFYKFLKNKHPEIKVYYIIDKNSADYEKVKEDAIQYGSLKSYWIVSMAQKLISTHYALILPSVYGKTWRILPLWKKFYFLQHGVTQNNLLSLHGKKAPMKLFICGAKPEYQFVNSVFGHDEGVVQYTGLARYDNLHNIKTKKQILVMPTWRLYVNSKEEFVKSRYFDEWKSLLGNKHLDEILKKSGYELIFYPHYEFQKYLDCFEDVGSNVKLASFSDYDVQTLLKESALLITDYSSVFFDFSYMKKPMMFFHFDEKDFFDKHYNKGYFNYEKDGFGKVCYSVKEVVEEIEKNMNNNFEIEDIYVNRIEDFFPLHDQNNCQRIYNSILER